MIRDLLDEELEQASGGFDLKEFNRLLTGYRDRLDISPYRIRQVGDVENSVSLSALTAVAPAEPMFRAEAAPVTPPQTPELGNLSLPICRDQGGPYAICQGDGIHERWERYRPQQPAFRSRFINR